MVAVRALTERPSVLVVDDDRAIVSALSQVLGDAGHEVVSSQDPVEALELAGQRPFDAMLIDVRMPKMSGIELLERLKMQVPAASVVMMTGNGTVEDAFRAVKLGAYDFLKKPFDDIDALVHVVDRAVEHKRLAERNQYLETRVELSDRYDDLVGRSQVMRDVFATIDAAAPTDASVLILGESGTGKELIARAIHKRSARANRPMVAVHCGAIAESLLESEMFGHVRGAFTGASQNRKGYFEIADGGTIFLDELGEMPPATQVKLLRVLQEGELCRVGSTEPRRVNVRVIAATNVDLDAARAEGRFRQDLYYRLNVVTIWAPPLRSRREDIPLLAQRFLAKYSERCGKRLYGISTEALEALGAYRWPGNVRELQNTIESAVVMARGETIEMRDLAPRLRDQAPAATRVSAALDHELCERPFSEAKTIAVERFERAYMEAALARTQGNISESARQAGLDRSNFRRIMSRCGL